MLTKLFGMSLDPEKFRQRFNGDVNRKLFWELSFFKMLGLVKQNKEYHSHPERHVYAVRDAERIFRCPEYAARELYRRSDLRNVILVLEIHF
jgi:hypothetical protein